MLFLTFDSAAKITMPAPVVEGTESLGYSASVIVPLGILTLACLALHLYRRTAVLGAVLLTGYLGGAVATHVRVGDPVFSHILFPVYLGVLSSVCSSVTGASAVSSRDRGLARRPQCRRRPSINGGYVQDATALPSS